MPVIRQFVKTPARGVHFYFLNLSQWNVKGSQREMKVVRGKKMASSNWILLADPSSADPSTLLSAELTRFPDPPPSCIPVLGNRCQHIPPQLSAIPLLSCQLIPLLSCQLIESFTQLPADFSIQLSTNSSTQLSSRSLHPAELPADHSYYLLSDSVTHLSTDL
jgi:hypothetical protein